MEGLPRTDIITVAHITNCCNITVHAGKGYKALMDSGATVSLLRYSTSPKKIEDYYKTPIQPTTAKLNTADGSPMSAIGKTALYLKIAEFRSTLILYFVTNYQKQNLFWASTYKENFHYHTCGTKKKIFPFKKKGNF